MNSRRRVGGGADVLHKPLHDVIVHDEAAANVFHDGIGDDEAVAAVSIDRIHIVPVHCEHDFRVALLRRPLAGVLDQRRPIASALAGWIDVQLVQFHGAVAVVRERRRERDDGTVLAQRVPPHFATREL